MPTRCLEITGENSAQRGGDRAGPLAVGDDPATACAAGCGIRSSAGTVALVIELIAAESSRRATARGGGKDERAVSRARRSRWILCTRRPNRSLRERSAVLRRAAIFKSAWRG